MNNNLNPGQIPRQSQSQQKQRQQQQSLQQQQPGPSWASSTTANSSTSKPPKKPRLPSSLKGRLAGPTAAYDESERIHILMAITLARFISDQELTSDPKPIFSETLCSKIREIITWPYFSSKVRPRGANPVPSNNAIRHIWYCLQTHGTARGTVVKSKRRKNLLPPAKVNTPEFVRLSSGVHGLDNLRPNSTQEAPPNWPIYGRDFL